MNDLVQQLTLGMILPAEEGEDKNPPREYWEAKYKMCSILADKQEEEGDSLGATKNYMRAIRALQMIETFNRGAKL
jgi:hypothetical protein